MTEEDSTVFGARLKNDAGIVLLVKPQATRPPEATFFLKAGGTLQTEPAGESFVFRRKELGGGRAPRRPRQEEPMLELASSDVLAASGPAAPPAAESSDAPLREMSIPSFGGLAPDIPRVESPVRSPKEPKTRTTWIWIPLSFIFLLLGVVLGFQVALSFRPPKPVEASQTADPYVLGLSVAEFNSSLHLKWNAESPAVKAGQRAVLHIQDGDITKSVALDRSDLIRGGVLYRNSTGTVGFRLEVFTQEKTSIAESVDIRMLDSAGSAEPTR
jgi:hypothetical protein